MLVCRVSEAERRDYTFPENALALATSGRPVAYHLPLAGLVLGLRPFLGGAAAERWAVAIAPMLPMLPMLFSVAARERLVPEPPKRVDAPVRLAFERDRARVAKTSTSDHRYMHAVGARVFDCRSISI